MLKAYSNNRFLSYIIPLDYYIIHTLDGIKIEEISTCKQSIICTINGKDYILQYSTVVKNIHVEYSGTLFMHLPFDFKYTIANNTAAITNFEPPGLHHFITDRITQVVLNNEKSTNENS